MRKSQLSTKYQSQKIIIVCLSIAVFGLSILSLTLLQKEQQSSNNDSVLRTVNTDLTEKINNYLANTHKFLSGKNYCASQVLGYDEVTAYARFSCRNDAEQGLGDTAKFVLKDNKIVGVEVASEANYSANIKKLLPASIYEVHSYYMTHYGTADLDAVAKMQLDAS